MAGSEDARLAAVLEDARRQIRETTERIEAVLRRSQALAENDLAGALQLLCAQPQAVSANAEVVALREDLTRKTELTQAIDAAIARCDELLAAGDLSGSLQPFTRLAKKHKDSAELKEAKERCEQKRRNAADAALKSSANAAREALLGGAAKRALQELNLVRHAAEFASDGMRAEWQAAREEAKNASGRKASEPANTVSAKKRPKAVVYTAAALAIALCIAGGIWLTRHHTTQAAPVAAPPTPVAVAKTYLDVDASPWATVLKIQSSAGKSIDLPGSERSTPMRLDGVPAGTYTVTLKGPDGQVMVTQCAVSTDRHLCTAELGTPDIQQALTGDRP
jgi:serine/threonine-protein kinase